MSVPMQVESSWSQVDGPARTWEKSGYVRDDI